MLHLGPLIIQRWLLFSDIASLDATSTPTTFVWATGSIPVFRMSAHEILLDFVCHAVIFLTDFFTLILPSAPKNFRYRVVSTAMSLEFEERLHTNVIVRVRRMRSLDHLMVIFPVQNIGIGRAGNPLRLALRLFLSTYFIENTLARRTLDKDSSPIDVDEHAVLTDKLFYGTNKISLHG